MNNWLGYLVEVNLFLLIIGLTYRLGFKRCQNYRFGRPYLVFGLLSALMFPLIDLSVILKAAPNSVKHVQWLEPVVIQSKIPISIDYSYLLFSFIIIVIVVKLFRIIYGMIKIERLRKCSAVKENYYQIENSNEAFSYMRSIFIGERIDSKNIDMILKHEMIHIENAHFLDLLITELFKAFLWYNPLIYVIQNDLKELHEFEADEHLEVDTKDYVDLLLQQNFMVFNYSFINQFNSNHLKNRIMRIKNKHQKPIRKSTILLTATLLIAGIAISQNEIKLKEDALSSFSKLQNLNQLNKFKDLNKLNELSQAKSSEVDKMPSFPGGNEALYKFMSKNVKYPKASEQEGTEGTVYIGFKVDADGTCTDFNVKRGVNDELDKAAMKAAKAMPKWEAAEKDGKAVAATMVLPIKFSLPKEAPKPPNAPAPPAPPKAPKN